MATFNEVNPLYKRGLLCCAERHLWHSGVALAIYSKVNQLTRGGESSYFTSVTKMAALLGCSRRQATTAFSYLDSEGWLQVRLPAPKNIGQLRAQTNAPKERWITSHNGWAEKHPGRCFAREALPWDGENHDTLGAQLYRHSSGKLRWYPQELKALRKCGEPDTEIEKMWAAVVETRRREEEASRGTGEYVGMRWKSLKYDFIRNLAGFKPVNG